MIIIKIDGGHERGESETRHKTNCTLTALERAICKQFGKKYGFHINRGLSQPERLCFVLTESAGVGQSSVESGRMFATAHDKNGKRLKFRDDFGFPVI